jgi:hypothetical protein
MAPCIQMELKAYCGKGVAWHEAQGGTQAGGFGTGFGCLNWF